MSVSARIRERREELGMNQTELAEVAGLTPNAISQYESSSRRPSVKALSKLTDALRITSDYLRGASGVFRLLLYLGFFCRGDVKTKDSRHANDDAELNYV